MAGGLHKKGYVIIILGIYNFLNWKKLPSQTIILLAKLEIRDHLSTYFTRLQLYLTFTMHVKSITKGVRHSPNLQLYKVAA